MGFQNAAALLVTALLFGGMTLFSFAFAAFLFATLPADTAGTLLRKAFPHFYLWVLATALVAAGLHYGIDRTSLWLLAAVACTAIPARQVLTPAINAATDAGHTRRFAVLHGLSVAVTLAHIAATGAVLVRFLS